MNFNAVCRTCLTTQSLNPIFVGSVDEKRYSAAVFLTTGIKVAMDDGLPQQMCARCISFSNACLKFRKQCKDAETRLLQVKNECDSAAETLDSGALDSEDFCHEDMLFEIKADVDLERDGGDVTVKSEADSDVEGTLHTTEEGPCQLEPAGGAGAAPERAHTRPEEGPRGNTSRQQQLKLRSCFVRLERFPIEDLHHNLHTCKTCLMTFDCGSSLRNHSCTKLVEESKFDKVNDETAKLNFKCDICGKEYVQKSHIIRHLAAHNVIRCRDKLVPYSSDDAKLTHADKNDSDSNHMKMFRNQSALTFHTGKGPRAHVCDVKRIEFSQKQQLIRHNRKLHIDIDDMTDKYICDICKKRFKQLSQVTAHMQVHTGDKLHSCSVCNKQFTKTSHLTRHKRIHTGEKPHLCRVCNKQFTQISHLAIHKRIHTGEKPHSCGVCNKQFAQKSQLTIHKRIHTGEKPHTCGVCNKQFTTGSYLIAHKRIHTGEKPYSCSVCNMQFTTSGDLTKHKRIHTGEKPYSCSVCNQQFTTASYLTVHKRIHTGEKPHSCSVCNKQFTTSSHLTRHKRIHTGEKPHSCSVCNKQFATSRNLTRHKQIHTGEKPYSRSVCNKQFARKSHLNIHIDTHTGRKKFSCDTCKKGFARKDHLIKHIKIHTGG